MSVVDRAGASREVRVFGDSVSVVGDRTWTTGGRLVVKVPAARIVVLTDERTASAAEAVVLALRSSGTTRSFGAATRGLTSYNEAFALPNGWAVRLTTGVFADVSGRTYVNVPLHPDVETPTPLEAAAHWLTQDATC